jgi:hypothetical protein
MLCERSFG